MKDFGSTRWAIAEGYIPSQSTGPEPQMTSHETACILNASAEAAEVKMFIYFTDRDPAGPYYHQIPAMRTKHIRFNDLTDPEIIPRDTDFACILESNVPVIVQHTRLDSRQAENALMTTIAYSG